MNICFICALILLVATLLAAIDILAGVAGMKKLSATGGVAQADTTALPLVSLIVPACNEETNIASAMESLLRQNYPELEIIAIDDRSTDRTGALLDSLACAATRLKVLHIKELPPGWLGKANALQKGAEKARGEYLLFTDGDIVMEPETVGRAVNHMRLNGIDHLCLLFRNSSPGWLLNSLILDSGAGLIQMFQPWRARKKNSKAFIGVGAFNMVRKEVYRAVGGHSRIRMHPIDDIMLGKLIKRAGFRQECLLGFDMVSVDWYESVSEMVEGLMKNILALINYRFVLVPLLLAGIIIFNILPLWGVFLCTGTSRLLLAAVLLIRLIEFAIGARRLQIPLSCAFGTLLSPYISCYIIVKATWRNMRDRGIYWRGTHYPLSELRKNESVLP